MTHLLYRYSQMSYYGQDPGEGTEESKDPVPLPESNMRITGLVGEWRVWVGVACPRPIYSYLTGILIHTHTNLLLLNYSILETSYPYLLEIPLIKSFPVNAASSLRPAGPRWSQPLTVPDPSPPTLEGCLCSSASAPLEWTLPPAGGVIAPHRPLQWPKGPLGTPPRWQRQAQRCGVVLCRFSLPSWWQSSSQHAGNCSHVIIPRLPGPAVAEAWHRPTFSREPQVPDFHRGTQEQAAGQILTHTRKAALNCGRQE